MSTTVIVPVSLAQRKSIIDYCVKNIGPQKYYLHNRIGGVGWHMAVSIRAQGWGVECSPEHALIITLKYGVDN